MVNTTELIGQSALGYRPPSQRRRELQKGDLRFVEKPKGDFDLPQIVFPISRRHRGYDEWMGFSKEYERNRPHLDAGALVLDLAGIAGAVVLGWRDGQVNQSVFAGIAGGLLAKATVNVASNSFANYIHKI